MPNPGQRQDVDLRVPEEPEQVLEQERAAAGAGHEEVGARRAVERHHQQARHQHRRAQQHQHGGRQHAPDEDRQPVPAQPRRAHGDDRDHQVDRVQDHRHGHQEEGEDVGVHAGVGLQRERRVAGPAGREAAVADGRHQHHARQRRQPERERLDARERHPPRADHERHQVVPERPQDDARHHHHHHRAVQADDRQVLTGREYRRARAQQVGADQHRVQAGDEEEHADPPQVLHADHLVVGADRQVAPGARVLLDDVHRPLPQQATERVVEQPQAGDVADRAEAVAEEHRHVVLVDCRDPVEVGADPVADPDADDVPDREADHTGEQVGAKQRRARVGCLGGLEGILRHQPARSIGSG